MATTNIRLGSNTLNGVETIKLTDASDTTSEIDFTYGTTPSGSVSVKLGENTLTGVNEISVMGTDNVAKSFGYAPSGYNVTIDNGASGEQAGICGYSLDDGATWVDGSNESSTINLTNVTQIKFRVGWVGTRVGRIRSTQLNLIVSAYQGDQTTQNYILTQNITDVNFDVIYD